MRKLYLIGIGIIMYNGLRAQTVFQVASGTELFIQANTIFAADGLVLLPSTDYSLSNIDLSRSNTISHYSANNYAGRVFHFSNTAPAFTGSFRFYYTDDVLNSIPESNLVLNVHNGTNWIHIPSAGRDDLENYIETNSVSNLLLDELALSDELSTLPLLWGQLQAYRAGADVEVKWSTRQEVQVSHFIVERSLDGSNWLPVSQEIAAQNRHDLQTYSFTDIQAPVSRTYYRIRQQDLDGRIRYSVTLTVAGHGQESALSVFPNPAQQFFKLNSTDPSQIMRVEIYNVAGALLQTWNTPQQQYEINSLASGQYHLQIKLRTGELKTFSLRKL